jgi:hypothetical protein
MTIHDRTEDYRYRVTRPVYWNSPWEIYMMFAKLSQAMGCCAGLIDLESDHTVAKPHTLSLLQS